MNEDRVRIPEYKYITVVYEVINYEEWGNSNPMHYQHNGLKAIGVSLCDLMEREENLECLLNE